MADPLTIAKIVAHAASAITDKKSVERKVLVGVGIALVAVLLIGTAFAGAFAASVPSLLFSHQKDPAAVATQIKVYVDLEARLIVDAIDDATAGAPAGKTVDANLDLPTWRYFMALTAVQCDQDFTKAQPRVVYDLVRRSIVYTYTAEDTSTVLATSSFPPIADLAAKLAAPGAAFTGTDAGAAAGRYLAVLGTFDETGHVLDTSGLGGFGGPGSTPLDPAVLGKLSASGVAVNFPPVRLGLSFLGLPYHWGSTGNCSVHGRDKCFDCSGLTSRIMRQYADFSGHGTTGTMWNTLGTPVQLAQIQPGDMIFWDAGRIHHPAMYIGGGKYVQAPATGDVVKISSLASRSSTIASIRRPPWNAAKLAAPTR